jgi:hypothetical protein
MKSMEFSIDFSSTNSVAAKQVDSQNHKWIPWFQHQMMGTKQVRKVVNNNSHAPQNLHILANMTAGMNVLARTPTVHLLAINQN